MIKNTGVGQVCDDWVLRPLGLHPAVEPKQPEIWGGGSQNNHFPHKDP